MGDENPVNAETARRMLGQPGRPWGSARMSAIKSAMGLKNVRYFYLSQVRKWLREHPEFRERDVYPRRVKVPSHIPTSLQPEVADISCAQ